MVVKTYIPAALVDLTEFADQLQQTVRAEQKEQLRTRYADLVAVAEVIAPLDHFVDLLATGVRLAAGYHRHRGQWRKRRHD